jgi:signal transduction histidine kinase
MPQRQKQLTCLVELAERLATLTDLDAILEAVADAVMSTLVPSACAVELLDHEHGELSVWLTRGLDEPAADWWRQVAGAAGVPTEVAIQPVDWPALAQPEGPPAMLRVALAAPGQEPVGALTIFVPDTAWRLEPADAAGLRNIVIQAAAAVTTSRARLREVLAIYTISQSITGRIDLAQLTGSVLRAVTGLFMADGGALVLAEAEQGAERAPQLAATIGDHLTVAASVPLLEGCTKRNGPFVVAHLDPPLPVSPAQQGRALVAPLWLERKLLGAIVLAYPVARYFRQSDLWLLSAIASQVTMALRNAQLYLWSEELAIAEERSRIARDIHDGLAQSLAHKIWKLDLCLKLIGRDDERLQNELTYLKASVRADIQDVRHSILALRPLDLEQRGLREAVQAYVAQFSHDTGIVVEAGIGTLDGVSPKAQTALFRLAQEALNNIRKHAQATRATVAIHVHSDRMVRLDVSDNGLGFDVDAALKREPGQSGIGLRGMIERTNAAGGTIAIDSTPGVGTHIHIRLPG